MNDIEANCDLIVNNLNFIHEYAKNNNISSLFELKEIFPANLIEACCKIVSINNRKKRLRELNETQNNKNSKKK